MSYGIFKPATGKNTGRSGHGIFGPATTAKPSGGRTSFGILAPATAPKRKHKGRTTSTSITVAGITVKRTSKRR
jgi:hypothetical protein